MLKEIRLTNDLGKRAMVSLDLFRDLLTADERGSEKDECIGWTWDVRSVTLLAVACAVSVEWSVLVQLGPVNGGRELCGRDGVLPHGFERDGRICAQGSDGCHVGEEGKRHRWIRVVDEGRHSI